MVTSRKHIPRPIAASTIVLAGVIWGGSFAAMQHALNGGLSVGALVSLRFLIAAVALAVLAGFMRLPWNRRAVLEGVWLGLLLTAIFWLQVDGLRYTTTAKSAFITGLYVMFTPLIATFWGEHVRWQHAAGAALATLGLYALVHVPGQPWGGWNRGDFETLLCSAICGVQIVLTSPLQPPLEYVDSADSASGGRGDNLGGNYSSSARSLWFSRCGRSVAQARCTRVHCLHHRACYSVLLLGDEHDAGVSDLDGGGGDVHVRASRCGRDLHLLAA